MDNKELKRLQKLACIKLSEEEEIKLGDQLSSIVTFLDNLKGLDTSKVDIKEIENPLRTLEGVKDFNGTDKLLKNVKHEKLNNCVVIKSVLS